MIRRLILFTLVLLVPTFASAGSAVLHTLDGGKPPYEPVALAPQDPFPEDAKLLTVDFIDHGASDSILLRCGGETMLVDGAIFRQFKHMMDCQVKCATSCRKV